MTNLKSAIRNPQCKTGTREWSDHSANCCLGCWHGCLYCYARADALRWKRIATPAEWTRERHLPLPKKPKKHAGAITMFPTTHDITPANLDHCLCLLRMLLQAGNQVLIVSKPHVYCMAEICNLLRSVPIRHDQVEFRFSIGAVDDDVLSFWEPAAPRLNERLDALRLVWSLGYRTSVSCEPLLTPAAGDAVYLVKLVENQVSGK